MNELQDNATRYLEEFVKDDLRFFGLPAPEECGCTWRSGIIRCSWTVGTSSVSTTSRVATHYEHQFMVL